ncbi:unnamed protein product [Mytilus coruscus]|uniref:C2H2-type domain-containing protein n=1 Tax=Mytilus coruscus TaxID=42192 RepID=A0A6J8ENE4_MYTCO|nr:unnamed protein product [Mytilus coruscus]
MNNKPPSLSDIINSFTSSDELQHWALDNDLMDHRLVQNRIRYFQSFNLQHILNGFTDADSLIYWATDNLLLNNTQVLDRLSVLLTCPWCHMRFYLSSQLREHWELHEITGDINTPSNRDVLAINLHETDDPLILNERTDSLNVVDINMINIPSTSYSNPPYNAASSNTDNVKQDSQTPLQYGINPDITLTVDDIEQKGGGNETEESPYLFQRSGQKTFSKNLATETTYKVKFRDTWKDKKNARSSK